MCGGTSCVPSRLDGALHRTTIPCNAWHHPPWWATAGPAWGPPSAFVSTSGQILNTCSRPLSTSCLSRRHFFGGKQLRVYERCNRATRCAVMHGARGDTEKARGPSTTPPSAVRAARCTPVGVSLQTSTAAPEAWHRSGPLSRSGTPRGRTREKKRPNRLTIPRDALPTRPSYFRLLAMASPH
jgi:hypothetical protein